MDATKNNANVGGSEVYIRPANGWLMLFVTLTGTIAGIAVPATLLANGGSDMWGWLFIIPVVCLVLMCGLFVVNPNESAVMTFFGKYVGTVVENGFFFMNPFAVKKSVSLRARNLNGEPIKDSAVELLDGDKISIGRVNFLFVLPIKSK